MGHRTQNCLGQVSELAAAPRRRLPEFADFPNSHPKLLARYIPKFPQSSTEPYQQQPQPVFGRNPQTPGYAPAPAISLDPNFRAAATRNTMIWAFTKAMDKMANG